MTVRTAKVFMAGFYVECPTCGGDVSVPGVGTLLWTMEDQRRVGLVNCDGDGCGTSLLIPDTPTKERKRT